MGFGGEGEVQVAELGDCGTGGGGFVGGGFFEGLGEEQEDVLGHVGGFHVEKMGEVFGV